MKNLSRIAALIVALAIGKAAFANDGATSNLSGEERALHVLNRLGYGPRPGDVNTVLQMGVERYIDAQLHPESIPLPNNLSARLSNLPAIGMSAGEALSQFQMARQEARIRAANVAAKVDSANDQIVNSTQRTAIQTAEARLIRAIDSPRQLEEVMVDFWFNHFNVFAGKGLDRALIASYERDAIRPFVLGHFRDLLGATAKHPAMLFYLDNWMSVAPGFDAGVRRGGAAAKTNGLNENYARELMELHTLGVDGGYSQNDVTELARMLTGWTFVPREMLRTGETFRFEPRRHDNGDKQWLGRRIAPNGVAEGELALDVLADHPATARHISYKLAQYFVADKPSPELVARLAQRFIQTRGDIRAVLKTLFASPEFWSRSAIGGKFKTPYRYLISSIRAAALPVTNARPLLGTLTQFGMPLYGCQTPDGYKNTEQAWLNPDALSRRINFATSLASGRLPLARSEQVAENLSNTGAMNLPEKVRPSAPISTPIDSVQLMATLGSSVTIRTRDAVATATPALHSALILGSPDFMRH